VEGENGKPEYKDLDIHGLLLVKADDIESIEFTGVSEENATQGKEGNLKDEQSQE